MKLLRIGTAAVAGMACAFALTAPADAARPPSHPGGKPPGAGPASQCTRGGYANYQTTSGARFATATECTKYVAGGGVLVPVPVGFVSVTLQATPNPDFCKVLISGQGFTPLTTYDAEILWTDRLGSQGYIGNYATTDAAGSFIDNDTYIYTAPGENLTVTVGGVTSAPVPEQC
ncbi:hypothetical protein ASC61_12570 [Aeromicrobium sp. Root344]|uniref:hypothetical protein n=1 Tax=Aeromicrobium sp. Root344 TaxID=1736521 RepID=UPI000700BE41|nr:hypothetical protein [Aeromicrobium sp. Root344]KQV75774.1 hypothetical protein ASC61_12570 [Aeromicrobium sp. Root344]